MRAGLRRLAAAAGREYRMRRPPAVNRRAALAQELEFWRNWFATREVGAHPVTLGVDLLKRTFGVHPTTLVCPGDTWTPVTLHHALQGGLSLVSARGLALRQDGRFCWCAGIAAIPLDAPAGDHFAAELPVIGRLIPRPRAGDARRSVACRGARRVAPGRRQAADRFP
jgi:hypothetical protein